MTVEITIELNDSRARTLMTVPSLISTECCSALLRLEKKRRMVEY
jgi:hypothetical protein